MRLRSLFLSTVLVTVTVLALSFLAYYAIGLRLQRITITPTFEHMDELQLESARSAWEAGGEEALSSYMAEVKHAFKGDHYLLDKNGIDVLTGQNHADLLPSPPATKWRINENGRWIVARRSIDGQYWYAAVGQFRPLPPEAFLPYYGVVIGAAVTLVWLASLGVIRPIQRIASTIATFGHGDLSVRIKTRRGDEIGQLGRSFNDMAERLERHIVSERRLLGDISHELRSPLARLKFAIKLARTSPDKEAALDRIEHDVNRIASLVADIVEITTVEGDPAMRATEPVNVAEVVQAVARDCAVEADVRGCRLVMDGNRDVKVTGSRELLRRAVENVVRNAIRYSPEGAPIEITLERSEQEVCIAVRDHGPGVPNEMLSRIFDPFFRVEEARNQTGGGSGLGLSIAKRAIQAHHGRIKAENANPGLRVRLAVPVGERLPSASEDRAEVS